MRWLACLLAITLVVALIWRSCASNADDSRGQTEPTQAAWRDAPQTPGSSQTSREPGTAPKLQDRHATLELNNGPREPGETETQYQDRMEVVTGLEAFRQRAGIGEERFQRMLVAIYDHQYNWARFQEAEPFTDEALLEERTELVRDMSRSLRARLFADETIEERLIWIETCRRCMIRIMFGSDMVRLDEPSLRPEGEP